MTPHAMVTILLAVLIAVFLFLGGVAPFITAAATLAFFGLRNDV